MKLNNNIQSVHGLRGIASLMVALFHFTKGFFDENSMTRNVFRYGWTGVEIFFVISGFVITWSMIRSNYLTKNLIPFLLKRIIRIEPPYLISIIIVITLNFLSTLSPNYNGQAFNLDFNTILLHIGYLVRLFNETWYNPVYWSLEIEFHFYILMAISLPFLIHKNRLVQFSSLITLLLLCFFHKTNYTPLFKYIDIFFIGIVIAIFKAERIKKKLFISFLIVIIYLIIVRHTWIISFVVISTAAIILFKDKIFDHSIFSYLGKISFSLYLIHVPLGGRIINIAKRFDFNEIEKLAILAITLIITIGISHLFYQFIEKPFHQKAKNISFNDKETVGIQG